MVLDLGVNCNGNADENRGEAPLVDDVSSSNVPNDAVVMTKGVYYSFSDPIVCMNIFIYFNCNELKKFYLKKQ